MLDGLTRDNLKQFVAERPWYLPVLRGALMPGDFCKGCRAFEFERGDASDITEVQFRKLVEAYKKLDVAPLVLDGSLAKRLLAELEWTYKHLTDWTNKQSTNCVKWAFKRIIGKFNVDHPGYLKSLREAKPEWMGTEQFNGTLESTTGRWVQISTALRSIPWYVAIEEGKHQNES
jgi:hypothetical protein